MSEIRNNGINLNTVQGMSFKGNQKSEESAKQPEQTINDLGNNPGEIIGRSQVKGLSFRNILSPEVTANVLKDLETLKNNPMLVSQANGLFDLSLEAYKSQGTEDPYAEAVALQTGLVEELKS